MKIMTYRCDLLIHDPERATQTPITLSDVTCWDMLGENHMQFSFLDYGAKVIHCANLAGFNVFYTGKKERPEL